MAPTDDFASPDAEGIRLQKLLAAAGLGSRRKCEELIAEGRVTVDGQTVVLGARVDPAVSVVRLDGERLNLCPDLVYLALNKPVGVLSAMSDDRGRPTVADYVADREESLFHVGRLDADTSGLLLLTNDGEFAHRLMHPSFEVMKTYVAKVDGTVRGDLGATLRAGVQLDDGPASVDNFRIMQCSAGQSLVELSLHEGRNRIVRRLLAEVGHPVVELVRVAIGPVRLGGLRSGAVRELSRDELSALHALIDKELQE